MYVTFTRVIFDIDLNCFRVSPSRVYRLSKFRIRGSIHAAQSRDFCQLAYDLVVPTGAAIGMPISSAAVPSSPKARNAEAAVVASQMSGFDS